MNRFLVCICGVCTIFCVGCGTPEAPSRNTGEQLHFGQGGGFTGEVTYFILLEDGRLYEKSRDSIYLLRNRWGRNFTRQMFLNYHTLDLESITLRAPGNLYYFLGHQSSGHPLHQIIWGAQGSPPPSRILDFYQTLYKSTQSKS